MLILSQNQWQKEIACCPAGKRPWWSMYVAASRAEGHTRCRASLVVTHKHGAMRRRAEPQLTSKAVTENTKEPFSVLFLCCFTVCFNGEGSVFLLGRPNAWLHKGDQREDGNATQKGLLQLSSATQHCSWGALSSTSSHSRAQGWAPPPRGSL